MADILLVEDDPVLGEGLSVHLELAKHNIRWVPDLKQATQALEKQMPQLILLDLGLPDGFGLNLFRVIKEKKLEIPVIVLTAQGDEETVVMSLKRGACDYVRKPFSHRELLCRIDLCLRNNKETNDEFLFKDLRIAFDQRKVYFSTNELALNRREFDIFAVFARRMDKIVSRESLIESLGHGQEINDRTIDSHISHIRSKIKKSGIQDLRIVSEYGVGYRMMVQ